MTSSSKLTRSLIDVAMGRAHADLVIRGGKWVCVQSRPEFNAQFICCLP